MNITITAVIPVPNGRSRYLWHLWRVGREHYACIIALATPREGYTIADFKNRLHGCKEIVHVSVELHYIK